MEIRKAHCAKYSRLCNQVWLYTTLTDTVKCDKVKLMETNNAIIFDMKKKSHWYGTWHVLLLLFSFNRNLLSLSISCAAWREKTKRFEHRFNHSVSNEIIIITIWFIHFMIHTRHIHQRYTGKTRYQPRSCVETFIRSEIQISGSFYFEATMRSAFDWIHANRYDRNNLKHVDEASG